MWFVITKCTMSWCFFGGSIILRKFDASRNIILTYHNCAFRALLKITTVFFCRNNHSNTTLLCLFAYKKLTTYIKSYYLAKKWLKYSLPSLIYFEKCLTLPQPPTLNIALPMHTTGVSNRWRRNAIWHLFIFTILWRVCHFFYLSLFF